MCHTVSYVFLLVSGVGLLSLLEVDSMLAIWTLCRLLTGTEN